MSDDDLLKLAWERMNPGETFSTANSDINVVYFRDRLLPILREVYDLGRADGAEALRFHYGG